MFFYWGAENLAVVDVDIQDFGKEDMKYQLSNGFHKGQGVIGSDQFYQKQSKMETLESGLRLPLKEEKSFLSVAKECKQLNNLKLFHKE